MKKYWMVMTFQPGQKRRYDKTFCARKDWADAIAAAKNAVNENHSIVCEVFVPRGFLKQKYYWSWELAEVNRAA